MTNTSTQNIMPAHAAANTTGAIAAQAVDTPDCPPGTKPYVSAGKRIHNEITYRGVDFLLNSAIGVAFTYMTARTQAGKDWFGKPVGNFFKTMLSPILRKPEALEEGARWGTMFTSIIVGGTTIMPIMTTLEDHDNKKKLVRWLDEKIYGEHKVDNDPKFAQCYHGIDSESTKDFSTGMAARFIVLAPMITATMLPELNKHMVKYLYNPVARGSKALCRGIGLQPKSLMTRGVTEIAEGDISQAPKFVSDWDFIHRTIGFDLGLTFIYSFAHEATYKALAAMGFSNSMKQFAPANAADGATTVATATDAEHNAHMPHAHVSDTQASIIAAQHKQHSKAAIKPKTHFTDYAHRASETEAHNAL